MPSGKLVTLVVWFAGMGVLIGLTVWSGADLVAQAIVSSGWAIVLVIVVRTAGIGASGIGWWLLFPPEVRPSLPACVLIRIVREGANALLPVAQIGGDLIGARCLALRGTRGAVAAASVIVDMLAQAATQVVFAVVGLVLLIGLRGNDLVVWPMAIGIAIAVALLAAFFMVQGVHGQNLLKKLMAWAAPDRQWQVFGAIDELFTRLQSFYSYRRGLIQGSLWHLGGWFVGAAEVWIVLYFMGYPVTVEQAIIIESLMHAVRGAAFAIPGALGAQEGSLIALCAIFGIPPEAALGLSLVKRIPDLVLGVPGLLAWQAIEGRHFLNRRRAGADGNGRA